MTSSLFEDPELPDLVAAASERIDRGLPPALDDVCRERPDLIETVAECLATASRLPRLKDATSSSDRLVGQTLGERYRLEDWLGAGAMGVVYRGRDLALKRDVAIKILRSTILTNEEAERRFEREASLIAAVDHPAVVKIYDRGTTQAGEIFLVLEYFDGDTLDSHLAPNHKAYDLRSAVALVADLCDGLEAAHDAGVFHRDVKPSNVFVKHDGSPVLLDFGIAVHAELDTITREDATIGTPAYMAPEALRHRQPPGPALDVYGASAVLYHLVTGRPPYSGTPTQILAALATRDPELASKHKRGLPRDLQAILDCGMARNPGDRYADASALERDLRAFLEHRPISVRPLSSTRRFLRKARRSPAACTGLAVALLSLTVVAGMRWQESSRTAREAETRSHLAHLSPNLALLNFDNRAATSEAERSALERALDAAVSSCIEPIPARLRRAAFRLDHGQPRAAAEDMRVLADHYATAYSAALAGRYALLPPDAASARAVDLDGLPAANDPIDIYLSAFHALRAFDMDTGKELIHDEALDGFLPATEIRLFFESVRIQKVPGRERASSGLALFERVVRFEEELGLRTATTAHLAAYALYFQKRYRECIALVREGLELAPWSSSLAINGGRAATQLQDYGTARAFLEQAIELRPHYAKPWPSLVEVLTHAGDFEEAQRRIDAAPLEDSANGRKQRLVMQAELDCLRALDAWEKEHAEEALDWAARSLDAFDQAAELGSIASFAHRAMSEAILASAPQLMFRALARMMVDAPKRERLLVILLEHMPPELDEEDTKAIRAYLEVLSGTLSANEPH